MYSCIHTGTHGPTCLFRANLAPFSLQRIQAALAAAAAEGADPLMLQYRQPVADLLMDRMWPTLLLVGSSTILATIIGVYLGIRGAWERGGIFDRISTGSSSK